MSQAITPRRANPSRVIPAEAPEMASLRAAVKDVEAIRDRQDHAAARLPALHAAEAAAQRRLANIEARHEVGQATDADLAAARHRADEAQAEHQRAERVAAGLRDLLDDRLGLLRRLADDADAAIEERVGHHLGALDRRFRQVAEQLAGIAAEALALAEAAGTEHVLMTLHNLRIPASITVGGEILGVGRLEGKMPPIASEEARRVAEARDLICAAHLLLAASVATGPAEAA